MTETQILFDLLEKGVSPAHAVSACEERLVEAGFEKLDYGTAWKLEMGSKYYVNHYDTTLFAFTLPTNWGKAEPAVRIAAAHTDFPCLRIKPACDMKNNGYAQLNIEVYGGAILNTWLDRPLGIAGRVALRSEDVFHPDVRKFISKKNITIPNLAIHMNREVNKGVELNKQTELLPITGLLEGEETGAYFMDFMAAELKVAKEDILDYELTVFCDEKPQFVGLQDELISAPRLDNLNSCAALVSAIINSERTDGLNMIALFDHEEIGSGTKQGAASIMLHDMVRRILDNLGANLEEIERTIYGAMLLSVDVAHALHPNKAGKMDITNKPVLGKGLCIKQAASQSYATDAEASAIFCQICDSKEIPYQRFMNRSDAVGGGTLGNLAAKNFPVKTMDIGVPMLAMHSARELMGTKDIDSLKDAVTAFFAL